MIVTIAFTYGGYQFVLLLKRKFPGPEGEYFKQWYFQRAFYSFGRDPIRVPLILETNEGVEQVSTKNLRPSALLARIGLSKPKKNLAT